MNEPSCAHIVGAQPCFGYGRDEHDETIEKQQLHIFASLVDWASTKRQTAVNPKNINTKILSTAANAVDAGVEHQRWWGRHDFQSLCNTPMEIQQRSQSNLRSSYPRTIVGRTGYQLPVQAQLLRAYKCVAACCALRLSGVVRYASTDNGTIIVWLF